MMYTTVKNYNLLFVEFSKSNNFVSFALLLYQYMFQNKTQRECVYEFILRSMYVLGDSDYIT